MQEKPPFSSYPDFLSNVREGDTPSHTHPLRTFHLPSGTPLVQIISTALLWNGTVMLIGTDHFYNPALQYITELYKWL